MKFLRLVLLILFLQTVSLSQKLPEWFRVYTSDESIVELDTNYVMFSNKNVERVRFRWVYQKPQILDKKSNSKYQSILQEIQFDCANKTYRVYDISWFDAKENLVVRSKKTEDENWQTVKYSSVMASLYTQACKLIKLRKREPPLEQSKQD